MELGPRCVRSGDFTHAQIETLYHELFHAYIDYLVTAAEASPEVALGSSARVCESAAGLSL